MIHKKLPGISVATLGSDLIAVVMALVFSYLLRFNIGILEVSKGYNPENYFRLLPFATLLWLISLNLMGLHSSSRSIFDLEIFKKIVGASFIVMLIIVSSNFFLREASYSRLLFLIAFVMAILFISLFRSILFLMIVQFVWKKGKGVIPLFIAGTGQMAEILYNRLSARPLHYKVVGFLSTSPEYNGGHIKNIPVLGDYRSSPEIAKLYGVNTVIVADPSLTNSDLMKFLIDCSKNMIDVKIVPGILDIMLREASVTQVEGIPILGLRETPLQGWNILLKRVFDLIITIPLLVLLTPVFIIIAILIKVDSKGPIFFLQERMGLDGRVFKIIKFRSMFEGAERETGPVFARPDDKRCTRVGRFLRKFNIDELPQLINVLIGDMSLVGPRPERPHFVDKFKELLPDYMLRHKVKAGLTGWAQVNGFRGNTPIHQRVKYDLYYIENWSLWFDLKIVLLTLLAHKNAY